jgi:hypothetical protein
VTVDEQAFIARVDGAIASIEVRAPAMNALRQVPMDLIAVAVMRQCASDGAAYPFSEASLEHALFALGRRYKGLASPE